MRKRRDSNEDNRLSVALTYGHQLASYFEFLAELFYKVRDVINRAASHHTKLNENTNSIDPLRRALLPDCWGFIALSEVPRRT